MGRYQFFSLVKIDQIKTKSALTWPEAAIRYGRRPAADMGPPARQGQHEEFLFLFRDDDDDGVVESRRCCFLIPKSLRRGFN